MPNVLSVENLSKKYGDSIAVDGISFDVERNEIVGLLGPNGAGKTTTINMVLSVLEPTSGSIHIEGIDVARQRSQALDCTNFAAVYAPLPGNLTEFWSRGTTTPPEGGSSMYTKFCVTRKTAGDFMRLFVNRRAYSIQLTSKGRELVERKYSLDSFAASYIALMREVAAAN